MTKTKKNKNKIIRKSTTRKKKVLYLQNKTPKNIDAVSQMINKNVPDFQPNFNGSFIPSSYSPTINADLVSLKSMKREKIVDCNNKLAFELKEPLKIGIPGTFFGNRCLPYYEPDAIKFLLKNLSANKHVIINKIVPPIQSMSNCWFNTMFVVLFVSDKGRKFFHFFRQLMIEGKQADNKPIPVHLRNGLALLNYSIDACLTGNKYAYILDTNSIIKTIYDAIPQDYKDKLPYITNILEAGNPIRYYGSLIYYLNNKSLQLLFLSKLTTKWKDTVLKEISKNQHLPHCIILEMFEPESEKITNKARSFFVKGYKYSLDSCVVRDISKQHFCALLTCENKELAYDGMSFHRLVPMEWKKYINSDYSWEFQGSKNTDGSLLKWNFLQSYQMLIYYRVK